MVQDAEKDRQELTLAHYLHQLPYYVVISIHSSVRTNWELGGL